MEIICKMKLHTVDPLPLPSTKYVGNLDGYWISFFGLQFVSTPSALGFRLQSLSSNSLLKHNLISYKYCSSFWFKQLISALIFSRFLMARCISIALNFLPGSIFPVDRMLGMLYFSNQASACSKYLFGVFSSWMVVAHLPCLFHWCFQNASSRCPKLITTNLLTIDSALIGTVTFVDIRPCLPQPIDNRHFIDLQWQVILAEFWTECRTFRWPNTMNDPGIRLFRQIARIFVVHCHPNDTNARRPRLSKCQIVKAIYLITVIVPGRCAINQNGRNKKVPTMFKNDIQHLIVFTH